MAGGGLKVAYQAGVLEVWLDELGLEFDHADGVSAGVFNLAMWCQYDTGRRIADNWRGFRPLRAIGVQPRAALPGAPSVLTYGRFRRNILPRWDLDWDRIRATSRSATFNLFDVREQRLRTVPARDMDEDRLMAAVSLPVWFPPVDVEGRPHVDAVHATGANLDHALDLGVDELWIVWTVSTAGTSPGGYVNRYFQIFEECTNSRLRATLDAVEQSNRDHAAGRPSRYGREVTVHLLQAEVPLHYLLNFRRARFPAAVDLGVRDARRWCRERGLL